MLCWVIHSSTSKQVATKSGFDFDTVLWMVGFGFQASVVWINNVGFDAAPRTVFWVSLSPCIPGPPSGFDVVVLKGVIQAALFCGRFKFWPPISRDFGGEISKALLGLNSTQLSSGQQLSGPITIVPDTIYYLMMVSRLEILVWTCFNSCTTS